MTTARPKDSRPQRFSNRKEESMENAMEKLAEYDTFLKEIPKELRQALLEGKKADALYKKYANYAAVRVLTIIAREQDSGKALAAAREVLDRTYGKPTERKEIRHSLEKLSDKELDALLESEVEEAEYTDGE